MKVQIASDLHIEYFYSDSDYYNFIDPAAKILILSGDIGSLYRIKQLTNFLTHLSSKFSLIIYVFGNCEFYLEKKYIQKFQTIDNLKIRLKNLALQLGNVIVLDSESIQFGEYLFSGCTLWSKLEKDLPNKYKIRDLDTETYNYLHYQDLEFLKEADKIAKKDNLKHIVITHYVPFHIDSLKNKPDLYMTELEKDFKDSNIKTWIYGHLHCNKTFEKNGIKYVSNQRGKLSNICEDYKEDFVIDI